MGAKACVAIGVAAPEELTPLPGAIAAAKAMAAWSEAAGFTPHLVTDEAAPVTLETLRAVFDAVLGGGDVVEHLIVFFAGHGLSRDAEDQQWLLTHWRSQGEQSVRLALFARLLQFYQPGRVSIIVDACRNTPGAEDDTALGSGLLSRPHDEPIEFPEDRFRAVTFGKEAYMLGGATPACLFSSVMLQALSGAVDAAVETRPDGRWITSRGLSKAVAATMQEAALRLRLSQAPSLKPGFVDPDTYVKLPIAFVAPPLPTPPAKANGGRRRPGFGFAPPEQDNGGVAPAPLRAPVDYASETSSPGGRDDFAIHGATVVEVAQRDGDLGWGAQAQRQGSLLLRLDSGAWIGAARYAHLIASFSVRDGEALSLVYRDSYGGLGPPAAGPVVNRLLAGDLSGAEALGEAAKIRRDKHVDPTLGAIAAYLYDAAGDRDSIRRMAWFYFQHQQPVPFDIALLADLPGRRNAQGVLLVDMPAVRSRAPEAAEQTYATQYLFGDTTAVSDLPVGGGFPWMRQGWAILEATTLPIDPRLLDAAGGLTAAPFTTLEAEAGAALAVLINQGDV